MSNRDGSTSTKVQNALKAFAGFLRNGVFMMFAGSIFSSIYAQRMERENKTIQHQRDQEVRFQQAKERLIAKHADYSNCMFTIQKWHRAYKDSASEKFVQLLEENDPEAIRVNACRSLTKDFWRDVISTKKHFLQIEDDDNTPMFDREHHQRFVQAVLPLDVLPGYTSPEKDEVYTTKVFDSRK